MKTFELIKKYQSAILFGIIVILLFFIFNQKNKLTDLQFNLALEQKLSKAFVDTIHTYQNKYG